MKRKSLVALILVVVLSTSMAFGLSGKKAIDAYYQNIKIYKDGSLLNTTQEPFIYNGTTYVPLRDVTESFGYDVKWNGVASSITLTSTGNMSNTEIANLRYQLQQKQIEINTLKYEIDKLKKELKDDDKDDDKDDKDLEKEIEDEIEDDYEEYKDGKYDIEVKDIDVDVSSKKVKIELKIDADKDKKEWEDRKKGDFEDYIEDICKMAAKKADRDIELTVKDKSNDKAGEYEYDESKSKFKVEEQAGDDDDDEDEDDEEDYIKDKINRSYDKYENGSKDIDLKVEKVDVGSRKVEIKLEMDVDKNDEEWEDRDKSDFRDLMEDICEMAAKKTDKDVEIELQDKDEDKVADYEYDEGDEKFKHDED